MPLSSNLNPALWSDQAKGTAISIIGILALTPDSLCVREVSNLPIFQIFFYKFLFLALCFLIILIVSQGFVRCYTIWSEMNSLEWVAGLVWAISNFTINYAFLKTAVANVLVILASNPMWTAIGNYFILQEKLKIRTLVACVLCFAAIIIVVIGQTTSSSGSSSDDVIGIVCALIGTITFGLYLILVRYIGLHSGREPEMIPSNIIAGSLISLALLPFVTTFVAMNVFEWFILIINGMIVYPLAFTCFAIGPLYISPTEVSLFTLLETIIAPIWIWLGGFGVPPLTTIYGGALLIVTLAIHSLLGLREERMEKEKPSTTSYHLSPVPGQSQDTVLEGDSGEL